MRQEKNDLKMQGKMYNGGKRRNDEEITQQKRRGIR